MFTSTGESPDIQSALTVAGTLSQVGAAALLTLLLLAVAFKKVFVPAWYATQLEEEIVSVRADLAELQAMFRTEVIPALGQAAAAEAAYKEEAERWRREEDHRRWTNGGGNAP